MQKMKREREGCNVNESHGRNLRGETGTDLFEGVILIQAETLPCKCGHTATARRLDLFISYTFCAEEDSLGSAWRVFSQL